MLHIDAVFFINIESRKDRLENFRKMVRDSSTLSGLDNDQRVHRFDAITTKSIAVPTWYQNGKSELPSWQLNYWCCRESHVRLWSLCLIRQYQHVLIFEDDALLFPNFDRRLHQFFSALPPDWFGYQLGGHWRSTSPVNEFCQRLDNAGGLHAYGLNRAGLIRIHDHITWHNQGILDHTTSTLYREEPHFYCPKDWFVSVLDDHSDNEKKRTTYGADNTPGVGYDW